MVPSCFVNEPIPAPQKMQVKKKFNHTALYTGIVSSRHSHPHVNSGLGSTAPPGPTSSRYWFLVRVPVSACLPKALLPLVVLAAQVWSPLKADKTLHALAFCVCVCVLYFVFFFLVSY